MTDIPFEYVKQAEKDVAPAYEIADRLHTLLVETARCVAADDGGSRGLLTALRKISSAERLVWDAGHALSDDRARDLWHAAEGGGDPDPTPADALRSKAATSPTEADHKPAEPQRPTAEVPQLDRRDGADGQPADKDPVLPTMEEIEAAEAADRQAWLDSLADADVVTLLKDLRAVGEANGAKACVVIADRLEALLGGPDAPAVAASDARRLLAEVMAENERLRSNLRVERSKVRVAAAALAPRGAS